MYALLHGQQCDPGAPGLARWGSPVTGVRKFMLPLLCAAAEDAVVATTSRHMAVIVMLECAMVLGLYRR